jgi:DNA mismatch repair ATPase MutS
VDSRLHLDAATLADLDVFGLDAEADSLYKLFNRCRTAGGEEALRVRMREPLCDPQDIHDTQVALRCIAAHRQRFAGLPSAYLAQNVERYLTAVLPAVRQTGSLEFAFAAFAFWTNDEHFYSKIALGVQLSQRLLASLHRFTRDLSRLPRAQMGALDPLICELDSLLTSHSIAQLAASAPPKWYWQKLRADQCLRLTDKRTLMRLLALVYEVDALVSLADTTEACGFVMPSIADGAPSVVAEGLKHPLVENAVANSCSVDAERRVIFLTGPNMAGKTTYLRAVATAVYMAHLGMGVCAETFCFVPVQRLITCISMADDLQDGVSYFRAEALRVKTVAQAIADGVPTVALMDEPFKGTNVKDAYDASLAVLRRFAAAERCLFLVSSHLIELSEPLAQTQRIDFRYFEAEESQARLSFDYRLQAGVSDQRLGMRVLEEEGVFELLESVW